MRRANSALRIFAALISALSSVTSAAYAAWLERPVRLVVAVAAGGPTDDLARTLGDGLGAALGGTFYVENRGGGGGRIGITSVARADPDGYTLLVAASSLTISAAMSEKLAYDAIADFAPICLIATTPTGFSSLTSFGPGSIKELVALSKLRPEAINYATPGTGTVGHLAAELLKIRSGLKMQHVAHTGAGPAIQSLLSGSVQVLATPVPSVAALVEAGTVKVLAVTSAQRWSKLPAVPTMIESGFDGFVADTFFGLLAPAATPADIVTRLTATSLALLKRPEVVARLDKAGYDVLAQGPQELATRIRSEIAQWREVAQAAGLGAK